ncbi:response regulator [Vibrio sp. ZSDZ34]|uniref:Response regulator n=1 Tax=Vibrio gelatinilyticus TaxID=2893468 RepID=A0A9X1W8V0_9VIBR|nr:response regulator [Vibrio gelatinilyticus]MCJ2376487.1 response regulator [Vibrio gelatinilyticus]
MMVDRFNTTQKSFSRLRFLIVDDSKTAATLIKHQLIALGAPHERVDTVNSFQDAIKKVEVCFYDVLLIDYHLEQRINGNELAILLMRRKLLTSKSSVILVSSDSSQQTVLTVISGEVQHFIKKPIKTEDLGKKILNVQKDNWCTRQIETLITKRALATESEMNQLLSFTQQATSKNLVENTLFNILEQHKLWPQLHYAVNRSQTPPHMGKVCAQATCDFVQGNKQKAIDTLEEYLAEHPLAPKIMDRLTSFLVKESKFHDALILAVRVADLTPSIGYREITAAQLAAKLGKVATLTKIGHSLASNLSVIDVSWITNVIQYCHCVQECYSKLTDDENKNKLVSNTANFFQLVSDHITPARQPFLLSYQHLYSAQFLLADKKESEAKKHLYEAVVPFQDKLDTLPSSLVIEIISLGDYFGETWLSNDLIKILALRDRFDTEIKKAVESVQSDTTRKEVISRLSEQLYEAKIISEQDTTKAEQQFKAILEHFPNCTEAQLGLFQVLSIQGKQHDALYQTLKEDLKTLKLPSNWQSWFEVQSPDLQYDTLPDPVDTQG